MKATAKSQVFTLQLNLKTYQCRIQTSFHKAPFDFYFSLTFLHSNWQKDLETFLTSAEMMGENERQEQHFLFPYCNSNSFSIFALPPCISPQCSFIFNSALLILAKGFHVFPGHSPATAFNHLYTVLDLYTSLVLLGLQNMEWVKGESFFELSF